MRTRKTPLLPGAIALLALGVVGCASPEGATVSGEVRGEGGAPLSGAQVELFDPLHPLASHGGPPRLVAKTGPDGRFRIEVGKNLSAQGLTEARMQAIVLAEDYAIPRPLPEVQARLGQATSLPLTLRRGVTLSGTLRDEAGRPVPGAYLACPDSLRVGLLEPAGPAGRGGAYSGADGHFQLQGLAEGEHQLWVLARDHQQLRVTVRAPAEGLELRLTR